MGHSQPCEQFFSPLFQSFAFGKTLLAAKCRTSAL
jgi:hypothetical protein